MATANNLAPSLLKESPARRGTVLVFDRVLDDPEVLGALESAGFEVIRRQTLEATGHFGPEARRVDVILAGIHELSRSSRQLIEHLRAARSPGRPLLVFGLASPIVRAMARGRRKLGNQQDRRRGTTRRHVFDDFISTPFEVSRLVYLIRAWELAVDTRPGEKAYPSVGADVLDMLVTLGGSMLVRELVELSDATVPELLASIRQSLATHDSQAMCKAAHSLKSTSDVFGAARMGEIAGLLETMGLVGYQEGAQMLAASLEEELARFHRDIRSHPELVRDLPGDTAATGPDLRQLGEVFRGRRILEYGLDPSIAERFHAVVQLVDGAFKTVSKAAWSDPTNDAALKILCLGARDHAEAPHWRAAMAANPAPVLLVLRDRSDALTDLSPLATRVLNPPGEIHHLLLPCYQILLKQQRCTTVPEPVAAPPPHLEPPASAPAQHLLLAEDSALITRFLIGSLRAAGFEVTHASNGQEAIDACSKHRFTGALLDITMPEVDGYGVLTHIRQAPLLKNIPVLMLSARSQEKDILKALQLGADDYVTKPFSPAEVLLRLQKLLERR